ncbi:MAG: glycolate oxidase [marine bacterium B5-7]|nr:MAG: glycolate oxidase [marine bacterium B5-7]
MKEQLKFIKEHVVEAAEQLKPLKIVGGNSKAFLGRGITGTVVDISPYSGIISYEPTELYITVRAGTSLSEINNILSEQGQMLAFDPPNVTDKTTIGGVVATGLSGSRRPYSGSVRDYILGVRCINGLGKDLSFGGQVMKNVAGYDLSRLMTSAFGTLGIILEVSLKVVPIPELEISCCQSTTKEKALVSMRDLSAQAIPISASCYDGKVLYVRLSGNKKSVKETSKKINFDKEDLDQNFWGELRDYKSPIFNTGINTWRISVPTTANLDLGKDPFLIDWGGGLYWLNSERPAKEIFDLAREAGGSAMLFRGTVQDQELFQPLSKGLLSLHKRLKKAFDPHGILNPGKMYESL